MTTNGRAPVIRISPVPGSTGRFVASFTADVLDATYAVVFPETVTGAIALHRFAQMIGERYGKRVEFRLDDALFPMRNRAVEDLVRSIGDQVPLPR